MEEKEEKKQSFLPALVNRVKYSRKVKVADIKTYLVDEFKLTKELDKENNKLKTEIEKFEEERQAHELALVTLDEYKTRLKDKDKQIANLELEKSKLIEKNKTLINERNEALVQNKDNIVKAKKIEDDTRRKVKVEIVNSIDKLKGHLTKEIVIKTIKEI